MEHQNKRAAYLLAAKKLLVLFTLTTALAACGGGGSSKKTATDSSTTSSSLVAVSSSIKSSASLVSSSPASSLSSALASSSATLSASSVVSSLASSLTSSSASSAAALTDTDGDGVLDVNDAFPLDKAETLDTDGDKIGNNADTDDDNDGVLDVNDAFPLDKAETLDTDGDKIGNNADTDDDNDGVLDVNDAFPLDKNETLDTDGDKIGNNADTDDDNDGVLDVNDAFPLDKAETLDTDGDKIGNNADTDDDGDGIPDVNDPEPLNALVGGIATLNITASATKPSYATISWALAALGSNTINLLFDVDGASGYSPVANAQALAATATGQVEVALPLLHTNFMNGRYLVELRNASNQVISSKTLQLSTLNTADLVGYVKASNTGGSDRFGSSVSLSADGNTLAVGAWAEASNATGINGNQADNSAGDSGAVYVFTRTAGSWVQQAYLKTNNTDADDGFGYSVALSADGNTLAVGASGEDSNAIGINGDQANDSASGAGAVYVFTRSADSWAQEAYIKARNTEANDEFGTSVALSADGNTLAVGAYAEASNATGINGNQADNSAGNSGAVYVFTRTAGSWAQQAYIKASNTEASDEFSTSVALSADGNTLAVGAEYEASNATGINGNQADNSADSSGAVYVFTRTAGSWVQQAYVKASNTDSGDRFGFLVALSADGNTLAVGAPVEDSNATGINGNQTDDSAGSAGAVYVFTRDADVWTQQAYIKASNTGASNLFGNSLALSADGNNLAVGAFGEASKAAGINGNQTDQSATETGAVYMFTRTAGSWVQQAYIKASNTERLDMFGASVALSADGNTLAVGADLEDSNATGINGNQTDNTASEAGAVYIY